jgi:hypothetical protein
MPRGGYSESTERWSPKESLVLLELIRKHNHQWTLIQQQMPTRTIHQIRCKWLRMRQTLRDYNIDTSQKRQLCKHCGEKLVAHICTKQLNMHDLERAKDLEQFRAQHCKFKAAPTRKSISKQKVPVEPVKKWTPTPPDSNTATAKDFEMLISYVNSVNTSDVLPTAAALARRRKNICRRRGTKSTRIGNNGR